MNRKKRSPENLRRSSKHLHYEVWMLTSLAQLLSTGALGAGVLNNASLEAFTIHVRSVLDFLYAVDPRSDDVIAEDFLPRNIDWPVVRPALTKSLKQAIARANKEVAHLTYVRLEVTPEKKLWHFMSIAQDVSNALTVFLQHATMEHLDDVWRNVANA